MRVKFSKDSSKLRYGTLSKYGGGIMVPFQRIQLTLEKSFNKQELGLDLSC